MSIKEVKEFNGISYWLLRNNARKPKGGEKYLSFSNGDGTFTIWKKVPEKMVKEPSSLVKKGSNPASRQVKKTPQSVKVTLTDGSTSAISIE